MSDSIPRPFAFPFIDSHVHLFPDRMFDAVWRAFARDYRWEVKYPLYTPQALKFLRSTGVEQVVFSNYAHKAGVADFLNGWNLDLLAQDENLYCYAAFHPGDEQRQHGFDELLRHPRVLGFKLQLLVQQFYPHDERCFPLYEKVIAAGKRILMHVGTGPAANGFVGVAHFRKVLERYPELAVTVPHMGAMEFLPFLELLEQYPRLYLDTAFAFLPFPAMRFPGGPEVLLKYQDRILYGSDFPNILFPWDTEINHLKGLALGDDFYRRVFRENALSLIQPKN